MGAFSPQFSNLIFWQCDINFHSKNKKYHNENFCQEGFKKVSNKSADKTFLR